MRYFRIMLLHFQHIFEHRSRSFVWFLVSLFSPLLFILFWSGAFQGRSEIAPSWTFSRMTSYYFLLTIVGATLMAHIEDDVSRYDIREGGLVKYLMKPFSYYWMKFFEEIHYRLLQGFYAIIIFSIFTLFLGEFVVITDNFVIFMLSLVVAVMAYFLSFTFKMIIGLVAFWTTDIMGIYHLTDIILLIFAGYIVPIELLSSPIATIAHALPFAYMIYYPVIAFQGRFGISDLFSVIFMQMIWLSVIFLIYRLMWKRGIRRFTGIGQ